MSQCKHIVLKGKHKGSRCEVKAKNGEYCYEHKLQVNKQPKAPVANLEDDPMFAAPVAAAPAPTKKVNSSVYTITVVSNTKYDIEDVVANKKFKDFIDYVFEPARFFLFVHDAASPDDAFVNIVKSDFSYEFEIAPTTGFLHAHILVRISHTSYLKIMNSELHKLAEHWFGKKIHIKVDATADPIQAWNNYIAKRHQAEIVKL